MHEKAGSKIRIKGCLWRLLKYFCVFLCLCIAIVAFFLFLDKNSCVRLPNGYMIGHPAIFHSNKYSYEMVLRNTNGEILLKTDNWVNFDRHPTNSNIVILTYGDERVEMPGRSMMKLIYDEKDHKRKWNEPDKEYPNSTNIVATSLYSILKRLENSKRYSSNDCNTPWFVQ